MVPVQIFFIAIGTLLADANDCSCDCDGNGVCVEQKALRTELTNFTKWNKYFDFVRRLEKDWQNQVAHVTKQQLAVATNKTIEGLTNAFQDSQRDSSIQKEEQLAKIESLENSFRAVSEQAAELDLTMEMISEEIRGLGTQLLRIQQSLPKKCGVDIDIGCSSGSRDLVWPWMASVYKNGTEHVCVGSVIHRHFVLTSAWCPFWFGNNGLTVKLGLSDLKSGIHVQEYEVQTFYTHPQFNISQKYDYLDYDIGLLELKTPIRFGPFVKTVCLLPRGISNDEIFYQPQSTVKSVYLSSYIEPPHSESPSIVNLTILSQKECRREIKSRRWEVYFSPSPDLSFCAATSLCPFRGSPVVQSQLAEDGTRTWTQVSLVILCMDNIVFGYRLNHLMDWVDAIIEQ